MKELTRSLNLESLFSKKYIERWIATDERIKKERGEREYEYMLNRFGPTSFYALTHNPDGSEISKKEDSHKQPEKPKVGQKLKIITIQFGDYASKTYDYLLVNHSGRSLCKDQTIELMTNASGKCSKIRLKRLVFSDFLPRHVTKRIVVYDVGRGYIDFIPSNIKAMRERG